VDRIDADLSCRLRRRSVPARHVGAQTVLARPADGTALVLPETAALVWASLDDWCDLAQLESVLRCHYPEVAQDVRRAALSAILEQLGNESLLERRPA
jgi:hypothetical protein